MAWSTDPRTPRRAVSSHWLSDPDVATAYAYLRPGGTPADRNLLAQPLAPGLHLAGEATSSAYPGTMHGAWFSLAVLAILGAHEMGHYLACRYYDVDASLPLFIPMPVGPTGTLGAVIRIREPIPTKRMLFDIGIAGPIAGFVLAVPVLVIGLWMSNVVAFRSVPGTQEFGEPLLFQPGRRICGGNCVQSTIVDSTPIWHGPPSRTKSTRSPRSPRT